MKKTDNARVWWPPESDDDLVGMMSWVLGRFVQISDFIVKSAEDQGDKATVPRDSVKELASVLAAWTVFTQKMGYRADGRRAAPKPPGAG